MPNALKLVRAQRRPKRIRTPFQQQVTANMSLISRTWRTLTDRQREGWIAFGQTWSPTPGKSTAKGITVFQALNAVRLNTHQADILRYAPVQPDFIGKLPAFTITAARPVPAAATLALSDAPAATPAFALSLQSPAFDTPVQILATRPLSPGISRPKPQDFRPITFLPALSGTPLSLSDAYAAQFPLPPAGMKLAIQIVPVTESGFKGSPFTQIVTVS